jgi:small GTP-binding protein
MAEEEKDYEILGEDVAEVNFSFKIIVIGDSAVGKSSLTLRGTKDHFKDFYTPTIGFEFLSFNIRIKDKIVKLQIWDTCGQEVYRSLISSFYKNSSLAIIVYSIDNQESFDNLESWLDEIKVQTHPDLKIFLIGNKVDLEDKRVVQKSTAEELAKEHSFHLFLETSAKSGQNAQLVFIKAAEILLENYKDYKDNSDFGRNSNISGNPSLSISIDNNDIKNDKKDDDKSRRKKCCK